MSTSHKGKKTNPKKGKSLIKLINKSDSDTESEHELSHYLDDRVKLMKEVLKIIKPKKIKTMAPKWMRSLDMEEINSMLFEELLGISNKRVKGIFNGQTQEEDSSSTDPEEENKPIDIISLDDISDDDFINLDSDDNSTNKRKKTDKVKVKQESKKKKVKKEKHDKSPKKSQDKDKTDEQNLMSVLELLELQARARAIRSQLALETQKKAEAAKNSTATEEKSDNEDAVIIESPKNIEIVITSSESENEESNECTSKNNTASGKENNSVEINESDKAVSEKDNLEKSSSNDTEKNKGELENGTNEIVAENDQRTTLNQCNESSKSVDKLDTNVREDENVEVQDVAVNSNGLSTTEENTSKTENKIQVHTISILRKGQTATEDASEKIQDENEVTDEQSKRDDNSRNLSDEVGPSNIHREGNECEESLKSTDNKNECTKGAENPQEGDKAHSQQADKVADSSTFNRIQIQKIRIFRKRKKSNDSDSKSESEGIGVALKPKLANSKEPPEKQEKNNEVAVESINIEENEGIIINVDQAEIECISD